MLNEVLGDEVQWYKKETWNFRRESKAELINTWVNIKSYPLSCKIGITVKSHNCEGFNVYIHNTYEQLQNKH